MSRKHSLRLVADGQDAAFALRTIAGILRPYLRELDADERVGDEFVDVLRFVPAPRRTMMAACRAGKIEGALKVGRRWVAPRAALERWLQERGPRQVEVGDDELEALRRRLEQT